MTAITKSERSALELTDDELLDVLESSLYPGAKRQSIRMVLGYCRAAGLDPMQKPVHIVPMNVKKAGERDKYEWRDVVMPGIGLYRTQAARTGQHAGTDEPVFGPMVEMRVGEFVMSYPEWCSVTVYRIVGGQRCSFKATEYWLENYATKGRDSIAPNEMWKKRTRGQIAKCAEAQALRKAFPEVGNQPTAEEMEGKSFDFDMDAHGEVRDTKAPPPAPLALEHYPADKFAENLAQWRRVIESGRMTADDLIAMISTKGAVTEEQKATLRAMHVDEQSAAIRQAVQMDRVSPLDGQPADTNKEHPQ